MDRRKETSFDSIVCAIHSIVRKCYNYAID